MSSSNQIPDGASNEYEINQTEEIPNYTNF